MPTWKPVFISYPAKSVGFAPSSLAVELEYAELVRSLERLNRASLVRLFKWARTSEMPVEPRALVVAYHQAPANVWPKIPLYGQESFKRFLATALGPGGTLGRRRSRLWFRRWRRHALSAADGGLTRTQLLTLLTEALRRRRHPRRPRVTSACHRRPAETLERLLDTIVRNAPPAPPGPRPLNGAAAAIVT